MSKKLTTKEFIIKARKVHGDKYDYSMVDYLNTRTKVTIICPKHGEFEQQPQHHTKESGCPRCGGEKAAVGIHLNTKKFIKKAREAHGIKYDYSKINYIKGIKKIIIICPKHGEFKQVASSHLFGYGCLKCNNERVGDSFRSNTKDFIEKAVRLHGNRYNYSKVNYVNNRTAVTIICPDHPTGGEFEQAPDNHLAGQGCPRCGKRESKKETEIAEFLISLGVRVEKGNRKIIKPLELDMVLPDYNIAIEYNGLYWHSEAQGKGKDYHRGKMEACNKAGYRLIHIWEDDYLNNKELILSFLKHLVGKSTVKPVYARKLNLKEVNPRIANSFLDTYHIQGAGQGSIHIGSYFKNELVAVTSFLKGKKNTKNAGAWELARHSTKGIVIGSLGKVVAHFNRNYSNKIYTFCDLCYFDGGSYLKAGFKYAGEIYPDYKYLIGTVREHKFRWRNKDRISRYPETAGMTESEGMEYLNIPRIWDCGKTRYELG